MILPTILYSVAIILLVIIAVREKFKKNNHPEKLLMTLGIIVFPGIAWYSGLTTEMEQAKTTEFCLSCHEMEPYGKSLFVDDNEYIPAHHFQNNLVDQEKACFTCHTNYTMFGDYTAKLKGFQHVWVHYTKDTKKEDIKLYEPFSNRECLHCHINSFAFQTNKAHKEEPDMMKSILNNTKSCMTEGCHDVAHDIPSLEESEFKTEWRTAK